MALVTVVVGELVVGEAANAGVSVGAGVGAVWCVDGGGCRRSSCCSWEGGWDGGTAFRWVVVPPVAGSLRVMWASVDGAACVGVAEGGVGGVLGVGVGDAPCSVREGVAGGGMVCVALVMTTVWALWVVVPGVSLRSDGRGGGPSPLLAEGLVGICGWLVCRSLW